MGKSLQNVWLALSSLAAWALGVGVGAVGFDTQLELQEDIAKRLDIFMLTATAIVFGLMTIAAARLPARRARCVWVTAAALGIVCATVLFSFYIDRRDRWSCQFASRVRIVVGATLTDVAADYVAKTKIPLEPCAILEDFGGRVNLVWSQESRSGRHRMLAALSYGAALSLAIAVFSIAQAVNLSNFHGSRAKN